MDFIGFMLGVMVIIGIFVYVFWALSQIIDESHNKGVRERNQKKIASYNRISLNMTYVQCSQILREMGTQTLIEESMLEDGRRKTIYVWYLGWHTVGKSNGSVSTASYHNSGGNLGTTSTHGGVSGVQENRTYIMLTFINDSLVSKTQQGLY